MTPPPRLFNSDDEFRWSNASDGSFSTKSTYMAIKREISSVPEGNFVVVWKWPGPESQIVPLEGHELQPSNEFGES